MMKSLFAILLLCSPATVYAEDPFLADAPSDTPAPSLGTEVPAPPAAEVKPDPVTAPVPPAPEAQPALPISSIPGKTEVSPSVGGAQASQGKDIYQQYDEYLEKEKERQATETDLTQRNLFPHENGAWQLGLNYVRNAFNGYNFDQATASAAVPNPPKMFATTQGANLLVTWFPLHSLTFGRLGAGVVGGVYWSTFETTTATTSNLTGGSTGAAVTKATPQQVTTYGLRAVYEFDYWLGQIVVPLAFVGVDRVQIKAYSVKVGSQTGTSTFVDFAARNLISNFYGAGVHFNLNRVEPVVASRALAGIGIRKFYISYLALQRTGELAGLTHNVGLNFEF